MATLFEVSKHYCNRLITRSQIEYSYLPVISAIATKSHDRKVSDYKKFLPILDGKEKEIVDTIQQEGVFVTSLDRLALANTNKLVNIASDLFSNSSIFRESTNCKGSYGIPGDILRNYPNLIVWGLNHYLLNIVENYIGLPIFYLGLEVKRDCCGGFTGVRKWHLDPEDYRMIKIIIYLNNVNENGGCFQYIPKIKSEIAVKNLNYKYGVLSDELMRQYIPPQDWISCPGQRGTVIFVDTGNVFHRAKSPGANQERLSITLHYISQYPKFLRSKNLSISTRVKSMYQNLSERQAKCLVPMNGLQINTSRLNNRSNFEA